MTRKTPKEQNPYPKGHRKHDTWYDENGGIPFKVSYGTGKKAIRKFKKDVAYTSKGIVEEVREYGGNTGSLREINGLRKDIKYGKLPSHLRTKYVALKREHKKQLR